MQPTSLNPNPAHRTPYRNIRRILASDQRSPAETAGLLLFPIRPTYRGANRRVRPQPQRRAARDASPYRVRRPETAPSQPRGLQACCSQGPGCGPWAVVCRRARRIGEHTKRPPRPTPRDGATSSLPNAPRPEDGAGWSDGEPYTPQNHQAPTASDAPRRRPRSRGSCKPAFERTTPDAPTPASASRPPRRGARAGSPRTMPDTAAAGTRPRSASPTPRPPAAIRWRRGYPAVGLPCAPRQSAP